MRGFLSLCTALFPNLKGATSVGKTQREILQHVLSSFKSPCSSVVDRRRPSTAPLRGRPSRKKFDPVCRADPVTLWRLYSTEWSKHSRAVEMSERSLRWSVKEAMMVKEVPGHINQLWAPHHRVLLPVLSR
ncbi:unnamed protein product [Mesocestoides corti]|uniref:Uncharacterized protein n=1 Tax=Mesocestoides corti TaxID=53468 RepID=A0A0R3U8R7_MESCO|nr:unnamed protein product [Mesocestoides corti]